MDEPVSLSDQVFTVPLAPDRYLVYAPLHGLAFVGNRALLGRVREHCRAASRWPSGPPTDDPGGGTEGLESVFRILQPLRPPADGYCDARPRYDSLVLFLTNRCNLRCSYCYASAGEHPAASMPWAVAKAGIDFVVREALEHGTDVVTVGFHGGGEPTLNWRVLEAAVGHAEERTSRAGVTLELSGAFNACWPRHVVDFMIEHFTGLSISFDGLPEVQDRQRPGVDGEGSYHRAARTLHALDEAGFGYGIRMTVTRESLRHLEAGVQHVCARFKPHTIQVEPAFPEGRAATGGASEIAPHEFVSRFLAAHRTAEEHGVRLFYSGARLDTLARRFCLAACRALVLTPEGEVTTCFEVFGRDHPAGPHFIVGRWDGAADFRIDEGRLRNLVSAGTQEDPECTRCFCRWHCAGDCAVKRGLPGGDSVGRQRARCALNQELTTRLLLERIQASGGVAWYEPRAYETTQESQHG
jgi:uncharacterized protein